MIKGLDELVVMCEKFVNNIDDFDVDVSTDFECYPETNEIFISLITSETASRSFMNNLLSRTEIKDISEFTWSLLHEVGHCETWDYLNKRTKNHCRNVKRKINRGSVNPLVYYDLSDEKLATNWAIDFVECNYDFVKNFDRMIFDIFVKMIDENNIEMEN